MWCTRCVNLSFVDSRALQYRKLLEETLDSGGHPLTTSPNALRDIVLPPSLLNKLLSVAGANINSTINSGSGLGAAGGAFSSPIPWRKAGLRYASNEIYFDMIEELTAIVNRYVFLVQLNLIQTHNVIFAGMASLYLLLLLGRWRQMRDCQVCS